MRRIALPILAVLLAASCKRSAAERPPERDPSVDPRIRIPASITDPQALASDRERDLPIAWMFLPEEPVPTGSAPNVIVAAELPCGFRPVYGTVSPPGVRPLAVRMHAMFQANGSPGHVRCEHVQHAIQFISLQRLRLGDAEVTDAAPRTAADGPGARVMLHVIEDNASTPAAALRRARSCTLGDDSSCTGGGVCAEVPGHHVGVCVPPIDPYLDAGHACADGALEITLQHSQPYHTAVVPEPGPVRACLPACDASGACPGGLACTGVNGVCVPQG